MATTEVVRQQPLHENDIILLEKILSNDRLRLTTIALWNVIIRIDASGRYHARIDVDQITYQFRIRERSDGSTVLTSNFRHDDEMLVELVEHKVAEVMLAHRRGHRDALLRKELRKPKQRQDD